MGNKVAEEECLRQTFECGKKQQGETKRILCSIEGVAYENWYGECPDFVRYIAPKNGSRAKFIGIEHFMVDQWAFQNKKKQMESGTKKDQAESYAVREKYKEIVASFDGVPDDALKALLNQTCKTAEMKIESGYNSFIDSFKWSFDEHINKTDSYVENLKKLARTKNADWELCFLLEVYSDFDRVYRIDGDKVVKNEAGYLPMFYEIATYLNKIKNNNLKYIIFCMKIPHGSGVKKVLALPFKDFLNTCKRQKVKLYHYACLDCLSKGPYAVVDDVNVTQEFEKEEGLVNVKYNISYNMLANEYMQKYLNHAFYRAYYAKSHNECYVTEPIIQLMIEVYLKYVIGWKRGKGEDNWIFTPIYNGIDKNKLKEEIAQFEQKYNISFDPPEEIKVNDK